MKVQDWEIEVLALEILRTQLLDFEYLDICEQTYDRFGDNTPERVCKKVDAKVQELAELGRQDLDELIVEAKAKGNVGSES